VIGDGTNHVTLAYEQMGVIAGAYALDQQLTSNSPATGPGASSAGNPSTSTPVADIAAGT
jgi:hypothetical protein